MAVAYHFHSLLAVEGLGSLLKVDVQVLIGVVVVHVQGDIDLHAPQLVHQGHKALQIH